MKKTRVAIVVPESLPGRGGIGRVISYLVRYLETQAPDLEISVHRSRLTDRPVLKHLSIPFALVLFAFRCLTGRVDIVHINIAPRGSTWRKLLYQQTARLLGKDVVLHLHGSGYNEFYAALSPTGQAAVQGFFMRASAVVVLSDFWKTFMQSEVGVPEDRIVVIANGVPPAPRPSAPSGPGALAVVAFVGIVGERKGVDLLLDALADVNARNLGWRAVIGGDGDVEAARQQAVRLGIADRVEFLGWIDEAGVDTVLRSADIFCLPSRAENQPVSILEAMARGLPVVASDVGAIPEQVTDGQTGFVVPAGDIPALADALAALITSPGRRRQFGAAGLDRFKALFSVTAYGERFAQLYRSLGPS